MLNYMKNVVGLIELFAKFDFTLKRRILNNPSTVEEANRKHTYLSY